ncbi:MAG: hypothetical protein AB7O24_13615 [Kofleriaceae bacterium]
MLERATQRPPSLGASLALMGVWFAGLVLAFVGTVVAVWIQRPGSY